MVSVCVLTAQSFQDFTMFEIFLNTLLEERTYQRKSDVSHGHNDK